MRTIRWAASAVLAFVCADGLPAAAQTSPAPPSASGTPQPGAVLPHLTLAPDLLTGLPRRTISVSEESGPATFSGVNLGALLAKNGAPQGKTLRGAAAADYVVARASDGYRTVFALAELDPGLSEKIVLLSDQRNGAPLGAETGPFRIVVPDEKHHLRWIRNVIEVDVMESR